MTDRHEDPDVTYWREICDRYRDENLALREHINKLLDPIVQLKMMQPPPPVFLQFCSDCPHKRAQSSELQDTATKSA